MSGWEREREREGESETRRVREREERKCDRDSKSMVDLYVVSGAPGSVHTQEATAEELTFPIAFPSRMASQFSGDCSFCRAMTPGLRTWTFH